MIGRVCWFVRSFVTLVVIFRKVKDRFHKIWRRCRSSVQNFNAKFRGQGQSSRSKTPYWEIYLW